MLPHGLVETTLRAAIEEGNALGGTHTINFSGTIFASGSYTISVLDQQLELDANFTINGPTSASVSLERPFLESNNFRVHRGF